MHSESGTLSFKVNLLQMLFNLGNFFVVRFSAVQGHFFNLLHTEVKQRILRGLKTRFMVETTHTIFAKKSSTKILGAD